MNIKCIVINTINNEMFALDFDGTHVDAEQIKKVLFEMRDWTDKEGDLLEMFAFSEPESDE